MEGLGENTKTRGGFLPWTTRSINEAGLGLVKEFEGLRLTAYRCPRGVWTIGYGHTRTAYPGMAIDEAQAESLLLSDLEEFARAIDRLVDVPLNDNEFSALVCFAFNVGVAALERSSLVKLLNRGWYEQVPAQMMRWVFVNGEASGGLSRRRAAEGALWKRATNPLS